MPDQPIAVPPGPTPVSYQLGKNEEVGIKAAAASFDGSGAAGPFVPALIIDGLGLTQPLVCPAEVVAAGESAIVSWFPRVGRNTGADGAGIKFDTYPQAGTFLYVETDGAGGPHNDGMEFLEAGGGSIFIHTEGNSGDGTIDILALNLSPNPGSLPDGSDVDVLASLDVNVLAGYDINLRTGPHGTYPGIGSNINIRAAEEVNILADGDEANIGTHHIGLVANETDGLGLNLGPLQLLVVYDLPTADPGVTGALWNDAGTVKVSP